MTDNTHLVPHAGGAARPQPYRWYAAGLLMTVALMYNIDRTLALALAEPIKREFALSDSGVGLLTSLFSIAYCLAGIPIGMLLDRVNRKRLLAVLLATWSCMTVLGGFSTSFSMLIAARLGLAAAESGAVPACMSLISDYFPRQERGKALGIYFFNNAIANLVGFSMAGYVALHYGWRYAFFIAGLPGLIISGVLLFTLREPVRGGFDDEPHEHKPQPSILAVGGTLLHNRPLLLLTIAAVWIIAIQAGVTTFMTPYFIRVHGLNVQNAGILWGIISGGAFAIGAPLGGFLADGLSKRSPRGGCYFLTGLMCAACPFAIIGFQAGSALASGAFLFVYQTALSSYYPATFSTYVGLSPPAMRGALSALLMILMNLAGYGGGPQAVGGLSDYFNAIGVAQPLRWALPLMVLGVLPSAMLFFIAGRLTQARDGAPPGEAK